MKSAPFSLATDGSNDSNSKLFPVVVKTFNPDTLSVESEVVSLPVLEDSATGKIIFDLCDGLLTEASIDWSNCIAFGCDNASVMTGVHKGVFAFIKQKNPNCVLSGCTLHLVHLAAEKASNLLPFQPADLLIDIFYYMKKSSVRQRNLGKWQEYFGIEQRAMLKHVSTRWLSIGRCVTRLIEDWHPLRSFFEDEVSKHTKIGSSARTKALSILKSLNSETAKLCCLFLKYAASAFDPFLTKNQAESPQIHVLHENMQKLMREILTKFVKPTAFKSRLPFDVEYKLNYNVKDDGDISIGAAAESYMNDKKYSNSKKKKFFDSVKVYYTAVCDYLSDNLPHNDTFLKKVSVTQPDKIVLDNSLSTLKSLLVKQPCLIPTGSSLDELVTELSRLQQVIIECDFVNSARLDEVWGSLAKKNEDIRVACVFLLNLLVVPHSSAGCEHVFSYVRKIKTDQRQLMGDELLESLIICKHMPG